MCQLVSQELRAWHSRLCLSSLSVQVSNVDRAVGIFCEVKSPLTYEPTLRHETKYVFSRPLLLFQDRTSAATHRTRMGSNASDGVASSSLTGVIESVTPRITVTNPDTVHPTDNDQFVRQSNLHNHHNRATRGGGFERPASSTLSDNRGRSEPIMDVAPPALYRKRETLPDIARRIPVDSLRPFLQMSLVSAAKVREL